MCYPTSPRAITLGGYDRLPIHFRQIREEQNFPLAVESNLGRQMILQSLSCNSVLIALAVELNVTIVPHLLFRPHTCYFNCCRQLSNVTPGRMKYVPLALYRSFSRVLYFNNKSVYPDVFLSICLSVCL